MKFKSILLATLSVVCAGCGNFDEKAIEKRIDNLYSSMSQEERIAQLCGTYMNTLFDENGNLDEQKCAELIPNGVGHFSQFASQLSEDPNVIRDRVLALQNWIVANTPHGIPALFHEEGLEGVNTRDATVYPQQIGLACSFNPGLLELKTLQTGAAMRQIGSYLCLSPMVDVVRTPSFCRLEESYGEDAYLSAALGTAFVRGLQGGDLRKGVGACSKHFLGYGGGGDADKKELMEEILLPHETIIRLAGSQVVMTGYHSVDGVDCVANSNLQQEILRDYLGFDGMMVSDYGSIDQIYSLPSNLERGVAAINAGNDVDFPSGTSYGLLSQALEQGLVSEETLERAVKNVLRFKAKVGLLDKNPVFCETGEIVYDTPAERETAYQLATQSVVLLQNDGVLPLNAENVFLTGPNANSMWAMLGDYSFQSMRFFWQRQIEDDLHPYIVSLLEGMESVLPEGMNLSYSRGCEWTEVPETVIQDGGDERAAYMRSIQGRMVQSSEPANWDEAIAMAAESDVIVAAMGENVILCGENRDRKGLRLPGRQEEYVEALIATGKPVVLVLFGGRAQVISGLAEKCAAVIQAWYPGEEGGNALADILYGYVSPSGKLSVSYPAEEIYEPVCYNRSLADDSRIAWPFGYGLSYTEFEYSDITVDHCVKTTDDKIRLSFVVENVGEYEADEIVQVYLSPASGFNCCEEAGQVNLAAKIRPRQLQAFKRVSLRPGESRRVKITLHPEQFGFYEDNCWNIAPGDYVLKVGASSSDIRLHTHVTLTGELAQKPLRDTYFAK